MKEYLDSEYDDSEEFICRENVWHFYAYFAENVAQVLHEFINVAEITDNPSRFLDQWHNPVSSMGIKHFGQIMDALQLLIDYNKHTATRIIVNISAIYGGRGDFCGDSEGYG